MAFCRTFHQHLMNYRHYNIHCVTVKEARTLNIPQKWYTAVILRLLYHIAEELACGVFAIWL